VYPVSFGHCDELPQGLHQSRQSLRLVSRLLTVGPAAAEKPG